MRYVVLGASAAGINGVRELRRLDPESEIILVSRDREIYSRCILHHYLGGIRDKEGICFAEPDFEARYRVKWYKGMSCTGLDAEAREIIISGGIRIGYDRLLIATGSRTSLPPVEGLGQAGGVYGFHNLDEGEQIKDRALPQEHIVVMGGGLTGVDAAMGFLHMGKKVELVELAERLQNTKGKKVYGYLPPATKALVDVIVDELAKDERVAAAYGLWNQMREEVCRTYSEQVPERLPLSKQKEFKAVRNMVVREVLQLGQGEHPTADEIVHMPTPPAQSGVPHEVYPPQQAAAHHQRTQTHRTVSHADTARCVLQLFHNMGRIFQEQSAADTIQAGLHIDKKRRRMLREKRMALGHKADDHEEIPQHSQR